MGGRCLLLVVVEVAMVAAVSRVTLNNGGYQDLVVGVSSSVPESMAPTLIPAIKELLVEASRALHHATNQRLHFAEAQILIPMSWNNTDYNETATLQTFADSDIRVDTAAFPYGDQPYTQQPGGCGEPGDFIHLTPRYLTQPRVQYMYGARNDAGKQLLMQWAMLRWGVFDELGYPGDPRYPLFYKPNARRTPYKTNYCANVQVRNVKKDRHTRRGCSMGNDGLPDQNCTVVARRHQTAQSSLLSYPFIRSPTIVNFCNSTTHVSEAPNKQNDKCGFQSAWEVMQRHSDFSSGASGSVAFTEPLVKVVKQVSPSWVVVLDYSGSMSTEDRVSKMQKTVQRWILHETHDGNHVGVVRFSENARMVAPLTLIQGQSSREALGNLITTDNSGYTSIGSGIDMAVQMLSGRENKNIMLLTDGEENRNPMISDVEQKVVDNKICVITIAYGTQAEGKLDKLAALTKCPSYTVDDAQAVTMLNTAFESTSTRQPVKDLFTEFQKIYESPIYETDLRTINGTFIVDQSVGRDLTFQLQTNTADHVTLVSVRRPNGTFVTLNDFDNISLTWTVVFPSAEVGVWTWEAELDGDARQWVKAKVMARARNDSLPPITATIWASVPPTGANAVTTRIKLYSKVKQGNVPVRGAIVEAVVSQTGSLEPPWVYVLRDNGTDPDAIQNDGIYSGYMTKFPAVTRYSLVVRVTGTPETKTNRQPTTQPPTQPSLGRRRRRRSLLPDDDNDEELAIPPMCCGSVMPNDPASTVSTGNFTRLAAGGTIKLLAVPKPDQDVLVPSRVMDLALTDLQLYTKTGQSLTLTWTAPGDDLDDGTVSSYEIRLSGERRHLSKDAFDKNSPTLLSLTLSDPSYLKESGEEMMYTLNYSGDLAYDQQYYVALRALDEAGNKGEVSNVVAFTVDEKLSLPDWAAREAAETLARIREWEQRRG